MGVASLVLGILALVCVLLPLLPTPAGVVLALIGIILGALGRKNAEKRGSATAGMVMPIIAFILGILVYAEEYAVSFDLFAELDEWSQQ